MIFICPSVVPMTEKKIGHIQSFFELEALDIDKNVVSFDQFRGKVTIVTNVASYCGKKNVVSLMHSVLLGIICF